MDLILMIQKNKNYALYKQTNQQGYIKTDRKDRK